MAATQPIDGSPGPSCVRVGSPSAPVNPDLQNLCSSILPESTDHHPSPVPKRGPTLQTSPLLALPREIRDHIYAYCSQTSISVTYLPPDFKQRSTLQLNHTLSSSLSPLSRTCHLIHNDLLDMDTCHNVHLYMGITPHEVTAFRHERRGAYRATYSQVINYLSSLTHTDNSIAKDQRLLGSSQPKLRTLKSVTRITTSSDALAADTPTSAFHLWFPNLKGMTMIMPELYPRELQTLVSKKLPDRWVDKIVTKGFRWMLGEVENGKIDRMIFTTVKDFNCLTCRGAFNRFHAVGVCVTVCTKTWTPIHISVQNGTFADREPHKNHPVKYVLLPQHQKRDSEWRKGPRTQTLYEKLQREFWEEFGCVCDLERMVAWWLGVDGMLEETEKEGDGDGVESGKEAWRMKYFGLFE